jgi:cytochrome P450
VITRYQDVHQILRDSRFRVDDLPERIQEKGRKYLQVGNLDALAHTISKWLFFLEPPDHTRLRKILNLSFSQAQLEKLRPLIQEKAALLLSHYLHTRSIDIVMDFAAPLAANTIGYLLGIPEKEFDQLNQWAYSLFSVFDQPMSLQGYQKQNQAAMEFKAYMSGLIEQKEDTPDSGLISQLIHLKAADEKPGLTRDEVLSLSIMLFIVAQQTTKALIGNSVLALLNYPDKIAEIGAYPDRIPAAVEELLRYDTPIQIIGRHVIAPVVIQGETIQAGETVLLCLGSANRDPEEYPNPDQLDFTRTNNKLPFGGGMHLCLGVYLARIQGQVAIQSLVEPLLDSRLAIDPPLPWLNNSGIRGLRSLPITLRSCA